MPKLVQSNIHLQVVYYSYIDYISNVLFVNFFNTETAGGAVFINNEASKIKIIDTIFKNCSTTKTGGAAYINAARSNINKTSFFNCSSSETNSIVTIGKKNEQGSFLLCSIHKGRGKNSASLHFTMQNIENINISSPECLGTGGSLHIGSHPSDVFVKYTLFSQAVYGLGVSLDNNEEKKMYHVGFENCTGKGALVITYTIKLHITNLVTFGCSNKLWYPCEVSSLILSDSWIKGVDTTGVIFEDGKHSEEKTLSLPYQVKHMYQGYARSCCRKQLIRVIIFLNLFS